MKFLSWHLGLGDSIAFADIAVKLADGEQMIVPCYAHNEVSVRSLFVNHPNIEIHLYGDPPDTDKADLPCENIRIGHYSGIPRNEGEDMVEWVYRTAGMDVRDRTFDVVAKAAESVGQTREFGSEKQWLPIIHDDEQRGFEITQRHPFEWSEPFNVGSILAWSQALIMAPEVHCIDSSFLHLVEQLQPTGKLFYHKYARPQRENHKLRHNWTVIE